MKITSQLLKGIFLIVLTIIGTTVENTFSCQALKLLRNNTLAKQAVIICLIYFTIDFTDDKKTHPIDTLKTTIVIWICYIIASKQTLYFTVIIFIILVMLYVMPTYKDYLEEKLKENNTGIRNSEEHKEHKEHHKIIDGLMENLKYILIIVASIGFIYYFIKESRDHKKDFSYRKFLFGSNKCDHDK